jgi:SAM-dependent methyltransferase
MQPQTESMVSYRVNPYVSVIENRLNPAVIQYAAFNRLTGDIFEPSERIRSLLTDPDFRLAGDVEPEFKPLIEKEFLIPQDYDPLTRLTDHFVTRPIHNPAISYRSKNGEWILVRNSMEHRIYSLRPNELPLIVEEKLPSLAADIFRAADGARTLRQIYEALREGAAGVDMLQDSEFRAAIDFLTSRERQLIKLTTREEDVAYPYALVNLAPRTLYHSDEKDQPGPDTSNEPVIDFHLHGIEEANWEFDQIEPTVNHAFRFPHQALGGLDYGSRFCVATLRPEVVPLLDQSPQLEVLEVGGGVGTFARSFIKQTASLNGRKINYHILDLSPVLMANQRKILSDLLPEDRHFQQNATEFNLPGRTFDLIISNEAIADFPVASVERVGANEWQGEGAYYVNKYGLPVKDAPDSFVVNAGAFRFIERAWQHLKPGGTLIVTEYGGHQSYPVRPSHLNHDEFSIHFGHLARCAAKVGFLCRLMTLKEFLGFDDEVSVLSGREEHITCLNHVFDLYGVTLPYAVISKSDFAARYQTIVDELTLTGYSFSPLRQGYHFGPGINEFLVLIMTKPRTKEI